MKFRRQARIGPYVGDVVCFAAKLIVEVDGGGHRRPMWALRDAEREKWLRGEGFEIVRVQNADVLQNAKTIADAVLAEAISRLPSPPRGGGRGEGGNARSLNLKRTLVPPPQPLPTRGGARKSRRSQLIVQPAQRDEAIEPSELVLVGHVAGAFGVQGEVKLRPYTAQADAIISYGPLLNEDGAVILTPKRARPIKDGLAVSAPEVKTREQAEALKGAKLYVPRAALPAPQEDEFYIVDLIGCAVQNASGEPLGEVIAAHDFGAGELLEIRRGGKTWYLPFTTQNAPHIDLKARRIIADPPPELLDPTEEP